MHGLQRKTLLQWMMHFWVDTYIVNLYVEPADLFLIYLYQKSIIMAGQPTPPHKTPQENKGLISRSY